MNGRSKNVWSSGIDPCFNSKSAFAWCQVKPICTVNLTLNFMIWFYLKIIADAVKCYGILNLKNRLFSSELRLYLKRMMECERVQYILLKNNQEELAYGKKNNLFSNKTNRFMKDWYSHLLFSTNVIIGKWCQKSTEQKCVTKYNKIMEHKIVTTVQ